MRSWFLRNVRSMLSATMQEPHSSQQLQRQVQRLRLGLEASTHVDQQIRVAAQEV